MPDYDRLSSILHEIKKLGVEQQLDLYKSIDNLLTYQETEIWTYEKLDYTKTAMGHQGLLFMAKNEAGEARKHFFSYKAPGRIIEIISVLFHCSYGETRALLETDHFLEDIDARFKLSGFDGKVKVITSFRPNPVGRHESFSYFRSLADMPST